MILKTIKDMEQNHMEALKEFGPTKFHRKSFKPCQEK